MTSAVFTAENASKPVKKRVFMPLSGIRKVPVPLLIRINVLFATVASRSAHRTHWLILLK